MPIKNWKYFNCKRIVCSRSQNQNRCLQRIVTNPTFIHHNDNTAEQYIKEIQSRLQIYKVVWRKGESLHVNLTFLPKIKRNQKLIHMVRIFRNGIWLWGRYNADNEERKKRNNSSWSSHTENPQDVKWKKQLEIPIHSGRNYHQAEKD